jgi:dihydrofolate synthase / folylpolyglutamate synthase
MTYAEALKYLDSFIDYEKIVSYKYRDAGNLIRVEALLDGLGNPQRNFKSIHIAGTKGKGSTCAFVYSILKESGRKAGLYTSPHLIDFKERIRISFPKDRNIDEAEVAALVARIKPFLDKFTKISKFGPPSFFEVYTALAFLFFSIKKVDIAVVEVGMGGRLDATNVVNPFVAGITPISFDHTDKLGSTLEAITKEKCGIIKNNCLVVASLQDAAVMNCIRGAAIYKNAGLYEVGKDIFYEPLTSDPEGQTFNVRGIFGDYTLLTTPILGRHQIVNAACAIGIIEALRSKGIIICSHDITNGIRNVNWPGRIQVMGRRPWIILDGAQNGASARALKETISNIFSYKELILVFGVSSDKDIEAIGKYLFPMADKIFFTRSDTKRAAAPEALKKRFPDYVKKITLTFNVKEAVELARRQATPDDLILVTGSLFVVGEALEFLTGANTSNKVLLPARPRSKDEAALQ